mmetsp:Transcript_159359/g.511267  ORF Transcript_159359/g.511267 Transcript_159359/m.511267 type:complete len:318 (-) Transcript_159359:772-1725(-)
MLKPCSAKMKSSSTEWPGSEGTYSKDTTRTGPASKRRAPRSALNALPPSTSTFIMQTCDKSLPKCRACSVAMSSSGTARTVLKTNPGLRFAPTSLLPAFVRSRPISTLPRTSAAAASAKLTSPKASASRCGRCKEARSRLKFEGSGSTAMTRYPILENSSVQAPTFAPTSNTMQPCALFLGLAAPCSEGSIDAGTLHSGQLPWFTMRLSTRLAPSQLSFASSCRTQRRKSKPMETTGATNPPSGQVPRNTRRSCKWCKSRHKSTSLLAFEGEVLESKSLCNWDRTRAVTRIVGPKTLPGCTTMRLSCHPSLLALTTD